MPEMKQSFSTKTDRILTHRGRGGRSTGNRVSVVFPGDNIQKALDKVGDDGGGLVLLRKGTHILSTSLTVPSNVSLEGEGIGNTIIDFNAGAFQIKVQGTIRTTGGTGVSITEGSTTVTGVGGTTFLTDVAADDMIVITEPATGMLAEVASITNDTTLVLKKAWPYPSITDNDYTIFKSVSNVIIRNLTITNSSLVGGVSASGPGVLDIENVVNFIAENLLVTNNSAAKGINIVAAVNSEFRNVESSYNGSGSTHDGISITFTKRVAFYSCSAIGNAGAGFNLDAGSVYNWTEHNAFYSCFSEGNTQYGFDIGGSNGLLLHCRALGNDDTGFRITGLSNNVLLVCYSIDNGGDGIELTLAGDNNYVEGCYLRDNGAWGIDILLNSDNNIINRCYFAGNASGTVRDANTSGTTIYQNFGYGTKTLANGANNNVNLNEDKFIRITGPTGAFSISGIAGGINGKEVYLYNAVAFDMTITNDATSTAANRILTLTGADVVLTGVSVAHLVYYATDARWILLGTQG